MKHRIFPLIMLLSITSLGASELKRSMRSNALNELENKQETFLDIPRERSRSHDRRSHSRERSLSIEIARSTGKCLSLTAVLAKVIGPLIALLGECVQ